MKTFLAAQLRATGLRFAVAQNSKVTREQILKHKASADLAVNRLLAEVDAHEDFLALKADAEQGDALAQAILGFRYYCGECVAQDYAEAAKWFRKAAEQGESAAQSSLAFCYLDGEGVSKDDVEAAKWFRKAAEQGKATAQHNLAFMYEIGEGLPQDYAEAAKWYCMAAEQGNAGSQNGYGALFEKGAGVAQDYVEAVKWYRRAADQGSMEAQSNLGDCYRLGKGVPQDYAEAAKWHRKAAEQGSIHAQSLLATYYALGWGVEQDHAEAAKWFRKAAEQGDPGAQFRLGGCYEDGEGVEADLTQAAEWYRKASEQGHARAQFALGGCYYDGEGVPENKTEGLRWYVRAAEQQLGDAQYMLGLLSPPDLLHSYKWFQLAADQGYENAQAKATEMAALMSPSEYKAACALYREARGAPLTAGERAEIGEQSDFLLDEACRTNMEAYIKEIEGEGKPEPLTPSQDRTGLFVGSAILTLITAGLGLVALLLIRGDAWLAPTIFAAVALLGFWKGSNTVLYGLTIGAIGGIVTAAAFFFRGSGFQWGVVGKWIVVWVLLGLAFEIIERRLALRK